MTIPTVIELVYRDLDEAKKLIAELEAELTIAKQTLALGGSLCVEETIVGYQNRIKELEADNSRLRECLISHGVWQVAPCCVCGYNGPEYYQPANHPCAARAKELAAELKEGK
jgi:hypothetical protein